MASRVAARLRKETDAQVEVVRGGLGEFGVRVDDRKVVDTNRPWLPNPSRIIDRVRELFAE